MGMIFPPTLAQSSRRVALGSFAFFLIISLQYITSWKILSLSGWKAGTNFLDLSLVVRSSECYSQIGSTIYKSDSASGCGYIYGNTLVVMLDLLKISQDNVQLIGWFFLFLISMVFGFVAFIQSSKLSKSYLLLLIAVFTSPPIALLLERGNFDILMIILIFLSAVLYYLKYKFASLVVIVIASLFKFYTFPLAVLLLFFFKRKNQRAIGVLAILLSGSMIVFDLLRIELSFPISLSGSFGNQIFGLYLQEFGMPESRLLREILGLVCLSLTLVILHKVSNFQRLLPIVLESPNAKKDLIFVLEAFFFAIFLCCYFGGVSYDYRLVFLQLTIILELRRINRFNLNATLLTMLLVLLSWLSFNLVYLQPFGDLVVLVLVAHMIRVFYYQFLSEDWLSTSQKKFLRGTGRE